jgi:tetratricopeptide (TPR) repeat protein
MALKALAVAAALLLVAAPAGAAPIQQRAAPPTEPRMERLERWLDAVFQHNPGSYDDRIVDVGKWSDAELEMLFLDASTVIRIIRNPGLASPNVGFPMLVPGDRTGQTSRPVRYTVTEISRLKQLACTVGGLVDAAPCEPLKTAMAGDTVLSSLSAQAASVRRDTNANFIVHRGALVHSDVVLFGLAAPRSLDFAPGRQSVRMSIADGHQTALTQPDLHWEIARRLMDLAAAPGTMRAAPGGDAVVRSWYIATCAWMQRDGHHDNIHIDHARELFPDDPDLAMLNGAHHEAYASPPIQTAIRSAVLPTGIRLSVESERAETRDAERLLRRATELKPDFAEAQIRLGHVLAVTGREAEAAQHLERGLGVTNDTLLQYYGALFLGAVEEKLGHNGASKASYERAAALYPRAQSPLLGLSELARRAGHRDEALRYLEQMYSIRMERMEDEPWWTYTYTQGRNADALLDAVQKPFRLTTGER